MACKPFIARSELHVRYGRIKAASSLGRTMLPGASVLDVLTFV